MPADLQTIVGVELVTVGAWPAMTGELTVTAEDIAAAVAAADDPHLRTPVLKLGHVDPRFDGEPAVGRVQNLRASDDGMTLVGDLVGVPGWLADILASAFPSRSIEAVKDLVTPAGSRHRFALTGLALLGVQAPAIETLADIQTLYTDQPAVAASQMASGIPVVLEGAPMPKQVAAAVNVEDIRRAYYDAQPTGSWAWVREVWAGSEGEPGYLIVDDDNGGLWKVPYTLGDGDAVAFSQPSRVKVEYVDVPAGDGAPSVALLSRRPAVEPELLDHPRRLALAGPSTPKEGTVDRSKLLEVLGLPADADDDKIRETLKAQGIILEVPPAPAEPTTTEPVEPKAAELPDGIVAIDQSTLDGLKVAAAAGQKAADTLRRQERDAFIGDAVKAGKFAPARREHFAALYDADEQGTRDLVAKLAAGTVPLTETGHASTEGEDGLDAELRGLDEQFHRL